MTFLIVQVWDNTKNNHAGMFHLCRLLERTYPNDYKVISIPDVFSTKSGLTNFLYNVFIAKFLLYGVYLYSLIKIMARIRQGNNIVFLEYLTPGINQFYLARVLRFIFRARIGLHGLIHLTPKILSIKFSKRMISSRLSVLDSIHTFGSSLDFFLQEFTNIPIFNHLHYSDLSYYGFNNRQFKDELNLLVLGNQSRNYEKLIKIISSTPSVTYHIVSNKEIIDKGVELNNVVVYQSMPEDELIEIMRNCNYSLGLYEDVVGSNVLSNCISLGIVSIVNDVGSVRDYLDDNDSFICQSTDQIIDVLNNLKNNGKSFERMRNLLREKGNLLEFKLFHFNLQNYINKLE